MSGEGLSFGNRKATCEFDASGFLLYTVPVEGRRLAEPGGWIVTDEDTGQATRRGVFAAGDNTGESQLAVIAIAEGHRVAAMLHYRRWWMI